MFIVVALHEVMERWYCLHLDVLIFIVVFSIWRLPTTIDDNDVILYQYEISQEPAALMRNLDFN